MKIHALHLACLAGFACVPGAYAAQEKAPEKYPGKSILKAELARFGKLVKASGIRAAAGG